MREEYFIKNLSDETIEKMTEKMLRFEKNKQNKSIRKNLLKIIPVVAMIALVIGLVNLLPMIMNITNETDSVEPNTNIDWSVLEDKIELFVPEIVEKSFFENRVLAAITDNRAQRQVSSYYTLRDGFYILDPNISKKEKGDLLNYYGEYTDLTGNDIVRMYKDNNITSTNYTHPDESYAHVRFGKTRDILLLDVEWYTYETFEEDFKKRYINSWEEFLQSDEYMQWPDEKKSKYNNSMEESSKNIENELNEIKEKMRYRARMINGKPVNDYFYGWVYGVNAIYSLDDNPIDISQYLDDDGFLIFKIYPYTPVVEYIDETGEWKQKYFPHGVCSYRFVSSKSEYDSLLKDKIIPFCDRLLEEGLLTLEQYEKYTIADPLDKYVDIWFN